MYKTSLDNIAAVEDQLRSKYQTEIKTDPIFTYNLEEINFMGNMAFFGILTTNAPKVKLFFENVEFIEVTQNNQIISLFTKIEFYDDNDVQITQNLNTLFRGYQIQYGDIYQI